MEAYLKQIKVRKTLSQFDAGHRHRELNRRLRDQQPLGPAYQKLFDNMQRVMQRAPRLSEAMTVYRGISARLAAVQAGDLLGPWGFTWCSRDESLALRFTADTSEYYTTHSAQTFWCTPQGPGTMLVLMLPPGVSYIERHFDLPRRKIHVHEMLIHVKTWRVLDCLNPSDVSEPIRLFVEPVTTACC